LKRYHFSDGDAQFAGSAEAYEPNTARDYFKVEFYLKMI